MDALEKMGSKPEVIAKNRLWRKWQYLCEGCGHVFFKGDDLPTLADIFFMAHQECPNEDCPSNSS